MPIMYVCEPCQENAPESCGYYDRTDLLVAPDGTWLCADCLDNAGTGDFGLQFDSDGNVIYDRLRHPPEHRPKR